MDEYNEKKKTNWSAVIGAVIALIALAVEIVPAFKDTEDYYYNKGEELYQEAELEVTVQEIEDEEAPPLEGNKVCLVTLGIKNITGSRQYKELLCPEFYDEEGYYWPDSVDETYDAVQDERDEKYMFYQAAREYLPPGAKYEGYYRLEVPENTEILNYTYSELGDTEMEVEIQK